MVFVRVQLKIYGAYSVHDQLEAQIMLFSCASPNEDVINNDCTWLSFKELLHTPSEDFTTRGYSIGHSEEGISAYRGHKGGQPRGFLTEWHLPESTLCIKDAEHLGSWHVSDHLFYCFHGVMWSAYSAAVKRIFIICELRGPLVGEHAHLGQDVQSPVWRSLWGPIEVLHHCQQHGTVVSRIWSLHQ